MYRTKYNLNSGQKNPDPKHWLYSNVYSELPVIFTYGVDDPGGAVGEFTSLTPSYTFLTDKPAGHTTVETATKASQNQRRHFN